ncbi:hemolysin family protein [Propionibacterium freudenreichii]|uniref:hemolysin family protein n=1 Tax=Propionibacterium freudenreichii TaxID=1744 RepID=UPI0022FD81AF|nr:hemolysin family protein [Propionibacterium freudenreichii]
MTQTDWIFIIVAVVLTVFGSMLAAGETALQTVSRKRAERMVADGIRGADRVLDIEADPAPTINTAMLLRIVCETGAVILGSLVVFDNFDHDWERIGIPLLVLSIIDFIVWGVMPRTLGRQRAEQTVVRAARPLGALTSLFGWLTSGLILVGNALTPGRGYADGPFSSEAELREMVDIAEKAEVIEHGERDMIHSVFELGDTLVREVMVPRTDVVFIESGKTLRQGMSLALRSGFSRIPVIGDNLDDVRGIVYLKDLTKRVFDNPEADQKETVDQIMRAAVFCPDSKPVDDLLTEMQATRNHMVVIVDEFGGSAGVATIEDLVEEIVGEITDEYDAEPDLAEQLDDGRWRISARMPLDEVGDLFDLELDDEDVETAGGLMAKQLNRVPIIGSEVVWKGLRFVAEKATGRRHQIDTIVVSREPEPEPEPSPDQKDDDD